MAQKIKDPDYKIRRKKMLPLKMELNKVAVMTLIQFVNAW